MHRASPRIAIVVEAIPPHCGGAEQVAWIQATHMARRFDVSVVTLGESDSVAEVDGVVVHTLPKRRRNLLAYLTGDRAKLNGRIADIAPDVIHCHMPNELALCLDAGNSLLVMTIHDGVPENEQLALRTKSLPRWLRFKAIRRANIRKSARVTCVSQHNRQTMQGLYPGHAHKMSSIPNPIYDRFFSEPRASDRGYVLNFGRQIPLKVEPLLETARIMPDTRFVFVGTGPSVRDHGLTNVEFAGFSAAVEEHIDGASACVFPSMSENFPLVGLEAMARGKPVVATRRGFSEYIEDGENGLLLNSTDPAEIREAIGRVLGDGSLRARISRNARATAEDYRADRIVDRYIELYRSARPETFGP
ncbi:MAG: glycosyltransferase family 4 protein [Proteobacteria bacterium]|nr:glycosyltransferase family 4 protein [Pseudomonadota bacterium]